jgi:hypothetical protein
MAHDRPTRCATDLFDSAAVEGARQRRSAKQQLDYWARVGRAVSMHNTAQQRRIDVALADTRLLGTLDAPDRVVANAEIDASIQQHAQTKSYSELLSAQGVTVVALGDDGRLVRFEPDGTRTVVE